MRRLITLSSLATYCLFFSASLHAGDLEVLTNHLGYEASGPEQAVILGKATDRVLSCELKND